MNQFDHVQIQQMVGRKRFDINNPDDRITVWLTTESKPILENAYHRLIDQVAFINEYRNHHFMKYSATKAFVLSNAELIDGMSDEDVTEFINNMFMDAFLSKENRRTKMEDLKLTPKSIQNDEYGGLLIYQLEYIAPIVRKILIEEPDDEGYVTTVEKSNIIHNYQTLVIELFSKSSDVQWRNKDEAKDELTKELEKRVNQELLPYLQKLEAIKLYDDEKRKFESEISYYFGASKKSSRLANRTTINEFINGYGFKVNNKRMTLNQSKKTVWLIEKI
ncbi:hypothetical protein ABEY41_19130 [Peribacillus butanolivorans]|uniref:hypothetical protein n=1 Tax=Peribacillus butanolivorans TaxID=421767 RepID=UPI003D2CFB63